MRLDLRAAHESALSSAAICFPADDAPLRASVSIT